MNVEMRYKGAGHYKHPVCCYLNLVPVCLALGKKFEPACPQEAKLAEQHHSLDCELCHSLYSTTKSSARARVICVPLRLGLLLQDMMTRCG